MISEKDRETIEGISRQYLASRVLLFGSSIDPDKESYDIDIAVEGAPPEDFFKYYGDLMLKLSKFVRLILQEGVLLYG